MEEKKFAILIDADNISSEFVKLIIDEATKEGVITYKRIYCDWTNPQAKSWRDVLLEYSINPIQQYAYTKGKNATDSAMIIDAMDILYTGNVDGFCLVSSDSDFTKLAARLKEAGKIVIGMGKQQTPKPFVSACSKFKYLDIISNELNETPKKQTKSKDTTILESTLTKKDEIRKSIQKIIEENSDDEGWTLASIIGTQLQNQYSDFDSRNYGCKKTIELIKNLGFETKVSDDKSTYWVKQKEL